MAQKHRLPFGCFACGKRFKNAQAVRGHCRHCRDARLNRQAEAGGEPGAAVAQYRSGLPLSDARRSAQGGNADPMRRRPGPLSHESKLLLLDAQDAIEQLQEDAGQFAVMTHEFARMSVPGYHEHAQAWAQIYQQIDDALRELDQMVPLFQLNQGAMFQIYNTMRRVKTRWRAQRIGERRIVETEPDGLDPAFRLALRDDDAQITRIIEHLKRLVAAAP